jgi:hypothetical protein
MAFWNSTEIDPKRQFKFKITFDLLGASGAATFLAQSADRPVYTITDTTKVDFLDKSFHYPGKITWTPVKIKFVDTPGVGTVNAARAAYDYLGKSGWKTPVLNQFGTINKADAVTNGQTGTVLIETINSAGNAVDTWSLKNAFITTVALNNLDYAAEGILTAEFTFRYDWAELKLLSQ